MNIENIENIDGFDDLIRVCDVIDRHSQESLHQNNIWFPNVDQDDISNESSNISMYVLTYDNYKLYLSESQNICNQITDTNLFTQTYNVNKKIHSLYGVSYNFDNIINTLNPVLWKIYYDVLDIVNKKEFLQNILEYLEFITVDFQSLAQLLFFKLDKCLLNHIQKLFVNSFYEISIHHISNTTKQIKECRDIFCQKKNIFYRKIKALFYKSNNKSANDYFDNKIDANKIAIRKLSNIKL